MIIFYSYPYPLCLSLPLPLNPSVSSTLSLPACLSVMLNSIFLFASVCLSLFLSKRSHKCFTSLFVSYVKESLIVVPVSCLFGYCQCLPIFLFILSIWLSREFFIQSFAFVFSALFISNLLFLFLSLCLYCLHFHFIFFLRICVSLLFCVNVWASLSL